MTTHATLTLGPPFKVSLAVHAKDGEVLALWKEDTSESLEYAIGKLILKTRTLRPTPLYVRIMPVLTEEHP